MRAWWFWTTLAGLIIGAALYYSIPAHADPVVDYTVTAAPAVCSVLDEHPTTAGVLGVANGIVADSGLDYRQAGEVIAGAVYTLCPRHIGLLQRFAETYNDTPRHGLVIA